MTYQASGLPELRGLRLSEQIRDEFSAIEAAFALLPDTAPGGGGFDGGTWDSPTITDPTVTDGTFTEPELVSPEMQFGVGVGMRGLTSNDDGDVMFHSLGTAYFTIKGNQDVIVGDGALLPTNATAGFFWIPEVAGVSTGVPASPPTGSVPMVYDSTNNKIGIYDGGWKYTAALV